MMILKILAVKASKRRQRDFDEDQIIQKTTNKYNNIVTKVKMKLDK